MNNQISASLLRRPSAHTPAVAIIGAALLSLLAFACSSNETPTVVPDAGCDPNTILATTCATSGQCHNSTVKYAGLDLTPPVPAARIVDKTPDALSLCNGIAGQVFLKGGSSPATGLILDDIRGTSSCGVQMPFLLNMLTTAQIACLQEWANGLTAQ